MSDNKVLIIKAGTKIPGITEHGDYEDWIMARGALAPSSAIVATVQAGAVLPQPASLRAAIITGSAAMVTDDADWIKDCTHWLRQALDAHLPILGICFGHQLLAHALGAPVDYNPMGAEVGTVLVQNLGNAGEDPLFATLPPEFHAHASHQQVVLSPPRDSVVLATTAMDDCSAFVYQGRAWGIQFHPEFDAAKTRHYIDRHRALLEQQHMNVATTLAACQDHPYQHEVLRRFIARVMSETV